MIMDSIVMRGQLQRPEGALPNKQGVQVMHSTSIGGAQR